MLGSNTRRLIIKKISYKKIKDISKNTLFKYGHFMVILFYQLANSYARQYLTMPLKLPSTRTNIFACGGQLSHNYMHNMFNSGIRGTNFHINI